jgi:hypothetical protein
LNELNFWIDGVNEVRIEDDGIITRGIAVSATLSAVTPGVNSIRIGINDFFTAWDGTDGYINWAGAGGTADTLRYDRSANKLILHISGNDIWTADSVGTGTRGLAISSTLGLTPVLDTLQVGDDDYKLYWDGTDPFLYFDTSTYVTLDRDQNAIKTFIATAFKLQVSLNGVRAPGIAVAQNLDLLPSFDRITIGDDNFYLDWDGTNPSIWWDADDLIWFNRNDNRFIVSIDTTQRVRVTETGTHVEGLTVSDPITALTPVQDTVQIGHNRFYLYYDGTDPWIVLDDTDSLWYDRSVNQLHVRLGSDNEHTFEPGKMSTLGTSDVESSLTVYRNFGFDNTRELFAYRDEDNSGSVNTSEVRGLSSTVFRSIFSGFVGVADSWTDVERAVVRGGRYRDQVLRCVSYGWTSDVSAINAQIGWWVGGTLVGSITYPGDAKDIYFAELYILCPNQANPGTLYCGGYIVINETDSSVTEVGRIYFGDAQVSYNMGLDLDISLRALLGGGDSLTATSNLFLVESLYSEQVV